jgi:putative transposase
MANTYSQIYLHLVFGVRGTGNTLPTKHKEQLHSFISSICANRKTKLYRMNTLHDHVHILVSIKPSVLISDLVKDIKVQSSIIMKGNRWVLPRFKWQDGFGAFSVGQSQLTDVVIYIDGQEEHHRKRSFREEYLLLLRKYEVEYDAKYAFDEEAA